MSAPTLRRNGAARPGGGTTRRDVRERRHVVDAWSPGSTGGSGGGAMELRDYLRMLRRGWPAVVLITVLGIGLAALYLAVVPKRFEAVATVYVSANDPAGVEELRQGAEFSSKAVATYALLVDSPAVLGPVAAELRPQRDVEDLVEMVSVEVPESTSVLIIVAAGPDPAEVAAVAGAAAASAARVLPELDRAGDARPLVRVQQVREAVEPVTATSPDVERVLAIGFVVGLALGLGITIAVQALDTRIRRADDVRALTDVPLLAVLPHLTAGRRLLFPFLERVQRRVLPFLRRAHHPGLVVRDEPTGAAGEAFRTLRTNLRFIEGRERRSLVFTAVADDHDGAQVPANLAWSLAQAGRRVLLVDLDLRQSVVADAVDLPGGAGLADVLAGRVDLPAVMRYTKHPRLRVVASGTSRPSPSDLLSAPMMASVLRRMEQEHDYVILHAPPLLSYSDAAVVSSLAAGTFVTVAAGRDRGQDLATALSVLANARVTPMGVVLTGTQRPNSGGRPPAGALYEDDPPAVDSTMRHHVTGAG